MNRITILMIIMLGGFTVKAQEVKKSFADHWDLVGVAVEEPGYTIWRTSPIIGEDGKTHLFVARWLSELKVDPGWRTQSEIAHYVGDTPEEPFIFSDFALKGTGASTDTFNRRETKTLICWFRA